MKLKRLLQSPRGVQSARLRLATAQLRDAVDERDRLELFEVDETDEQLIADKVAEWEHWQLEVDERTRNLLRLLNENDPNNASAEGAD